MKNRRALVAGNWKMNGSRAEIELLVAGILAQRSSADCDVAVFPPYVYLYLLQQLLESGNVGFGVQNISHQASGAYTGEVACSMVTDFGCQYALVGHSERRAYYAETDEIVSEKFAACTKAAITPVLCIGETLEQRQQGQTKDIVRQQLGVVLDRCGIAGFAQAVIAYEPVWAIGTGVSASPEEAEDVHAVIREVLMQRDSAIGQKIRLLYGGSVTAESAASLFAQENIDGALVGGASLNSTEFIKICQFAGY